MGTVILNMSKLSLRKIQVGLRSKLTNVTVTKLRGFLAKGSVVHFFFFYLILIFNGT